MRSAVLQLRVDALLNEDEGEMERELYLYMLLTLHRDCVKVSIFVYSDAMGPWQRREMQPWSKGQDCATTDQATLAEPSPWGYIATRIAAATCSGRREVRKGLQSQLANHHRESAILLSCYRLKPAVR